MIAQQKLLFIQIVCYTVFVVRTMPARSSERPSGRSAPDSEMAP
jgi:hypothetical protein